MEDESSEPEPEAPISPWSRAPAECRHDGWTGDRMAIFCETLAETGLVVDACLAAGKSTNTAYATRRRVPVFAAAWEAALTIARERLADTLLARSIEGTTEQYYKDGALVGEKRVIDNRLGLAILRRLDRMAETGSPLHSNPPLFPGQSRGPGLGYGLRRSAETGSLDWDLALSALRSGDPDAVAEALAMLQSGKAHEAHDPPNQPPSPEVGDAEDPSEERDYDGPIRTWCDDGVWYTYFAPPPGYVDYEKGNWGEYGYKRGCTDEETRLLGAEALAEIADERAEDEAERDAWFAELKTDLEAAERLPAGDPDEPKEDSAAQ